MTEATTTLTRAGMGASIPLVGANNGLIKASGKPGKAHRPPIRHGLPYFILDRRQLHANEMGYVSQHLVLVER